MITEDRLRSLLAEVAVRFEPPPNGPAGVVEAASSPSGRRRRAHPVRRPRWSRPPVTPRRLVAAATAAVVVMAAGLAWVDRRDSGVETGQLAGPAPGSPQSRPKALESSEPSGAGSPQPAPQPAPAAAPAAAAGAGPGRATAPAAATSPANAPGPASAHSLAQPQAQAQAAVGSAAMASDSGLAKIVRTGAMDLAVGKGQVDDAMAAISRLATGAGGYVADSTTNESRGRPAASATLRVPAEGFESLTASLRRLGKVRRASSASRDVTGEHTDVHARLRALNGTRDSLLRVLAGASAVGDILAVQSNLGSVQSEIEQLQGRQRVLDDQIALATIAVSLQEPGSERAPANPRGKAEGSSWQRAVDGFTGTWSSLLAHSGTALAVVSMAAMALAALVGLGRRGRRAYARWVA